MDYQEFRMIYTLSDGQNGVAYSLNIEGLDVFKNQDLLKSYVIHGFNGYSWEAIENITLP